MKKSEYAPGLRVFSGDAPGYKGCTVGPLWLVKKQYYCKVAFDYQQGAERDRPYQRSDSRQNNLSKYLEKIMVLYGFKKEFAPLVESGQKLHTIRDMRKDNRHAKPGDNLQLYTGLRTAACRKLIDAKCWDVFNITIASANRIIWINGIQLSPDQVTQLITGDGFSSAFDFWAFFPTCNDRLLICWAKIDWLKPFQKVEISNG